MMHVLLGAFLYEMHTISTEDCLVCMKCHARLTQGSWSALIALMLDGGSQEHGWDVLPLGCCEDGHSRGEGG